MEKVLVQVAEFNDRFYDPTEPQKFYRGGEIVELPLKNPVVEECLKDGRLRSVDSSQVEVLKKIQLAKVNPEILEERQRYQAGLEELREVKEQMQMLLKENKDLRNNLAKEQAKLEKSKSRKTSKKEDS